MCFGFHDLIELENQNFITAIAIDSPQEKKIEVTTFHSDFDYFQKNSTDENQKYVSTALSDSIQNALCKINRQLEKNLYLGHTQIIFIDKKLLRDKSFLKKIVSELENNTAMNSQTKLTFVTDAKKILTEKFSPNLLNSIKNKQDEKAMTIDKLWSSFHEA